MEAIPNADGHPSGNPDGRSHAKKTLGPFGRSYVRRLWQTGSRPQGGVGQVPMVDLLDHAGLLVPRGLVLRKEAHREFLDQSGLLGDLRAHAGDGEGHAPRLLRRCLSHRSSMIEGELNRAICDALIGLGSPSVTVASEGSAAMHLKSIPEVKDAIREAWLSVKGLPRSGDPDLARADPRRGGLVKAHDGPRKHSRGRRRQRIRGTLLEASRGQKQAPQEVRPCTT